MMARLKKDFLYLCFLNQLPLRTHYALWPTPNTDLGTVICLAITALGPEDFVLFGGCGVGVLILLDVLLIWILKMSNLRDLELIDLTSMDSKEFYSFLWKTAQAKATEESILKLY